MILRIFLVLGALLGASYALLLPPLQAPDEFAHFFRAYSISDGSCIAPKSTRIPVSIQEMAAAFQLDMEETQRIDSGYILAFLHKPLNDERRDGVANEAIDVYSCVPYLPQAAGIGAGRLFKAPPAAIFYLSRFANLIAYLALVALALRQVPSFQLPLFAVALMPMALHQAASASWDGMVFAAAFFLFAYILGLVRNPEIRALQPRHYAILGGAIVLAGLCKTDVWLASLLVLVPASKFNGARRKWAVLLGVALLALLVIGGWNYVNREDMARWAAALRDRRQIYLSDNLAFILHHPWVFVQVSLRTWSVRGVDIASQVIGRLGWLAVVLPSWCIWVYVALLGLVALAADGLKTVTQRLVCLGVAAVGIASVFVAIWCAETTRSYSDTVLAGSGIVPGVQGRYLIPFVLPLLLAISGGWLRIDRKWLLAVVSLTIFTINAVALREIHRTYYLSDAGPYENKLVRRAGNTPEDGKVFLVRGGKRHWIIFGSWIDKHGYKPADLMILQPEQLNSIPEGKVISEQ
jgi:uncharacterized membrane protein